MFLSFLTSKLGIGILAMVVLSGGALYVKHLIEKQVLMERDLEDREIALEGMAGEFSNYAMNSEAVIEAYNVNNDLLQKEYQKSRDIVSTSIERSIKHDYQKLLNASPTAFLKRANAATSKLFLEFEEISDYSEDDEDRDDTKASVPR